MKQILGKINQDIIDKWYLQEHKEKNIVFYSDRKDHCEEHKEQYDSEKDFNYVMSNLKNIIRYPDYVYYDVNKKGLEYYKSVKGNVLVAVRISSGNELKVRSVYPVSKAKIENRKKKESKALEEALLEKYRYKETIN